jgi:hypothetical protein
MIVTKKHLDRRTLLRGIGSALALPFLDAMTPAFAGPATKPGSGLRMAFVYVPNGVVMENWTPKVAGSDFEFTRILQPLAPFREHTTIVSGLMNHQANALGDGGGDHARAGASFLTGAHPKKTGGSDIRAGVSVDQLAAKRLGGDTRLASLELGLDDSRVVGHCDSGYSCAYSNSISWKSESTPLPPEASPRIVFERLFGDIDTSIDAATRARRAKYRRSLLDSTLDETHRLSESLGASDKRKVDEYLTSIREVESRIQRTESDTRQIEPPVEKPSGIPAAYADHAKLLFDLQAIAFQADLTRVASMVMGREGSVRTYDEIGVSEPHHPLSHHRNLPDALEKLAKINTFHVDLFAQFVAKLKATTDGDATLLDRCLIVYGCGISDSNRHLHDNLPVAVVGKGNNWLPGGHHVRFEKPVPVTNLYLSMLDRAGVQIDSFGDSTGKLVL